MQSGRGLRATASRHTESRTHTLARPASPRGNSLLAASAKLSVAPVKPKIEWTAADRIEYLKEDLSHLFDDKGIDPNGYDEVVDFVDPITKYSDLKGFLFNISMLKLVFNPRFILHDIKPASENSIITRWTMAMEFSLAKKIPLLSRWWCPSILFTGTSEYVFNPATGRIFRHLDEWDSITNQKYFSLEGAQDFFRQLLALYSTPSLETAPYTVLKRRRDYEVRRYDPFLVAECDMDSAAAGSTQQMMNPAGSGMRAFNLLAGYTLGGVNARRERLAMTTPVFTSSAGRMQFVITPSVHKDLSSAPAPSAPEVQARQEPGGLFAARIFSGTAAEDAVLDQERQLRASLKRDGEAPAGTAWQLARYNDPSVRSFLRRNEVLIPLERFELW